MAQGESPGTSSRVVNACQGRLGELLGRAVCSRVAVFPGAGAKPYGTCLLTMVDFGLRYFGSDKGLGVKFCERVLDNFRTGAGHLQSVAHERLVAFARV